MQCATKGSIVVRCPSDMRDELKEIAARQGETVSTVVSSMNAYFGGRSIPSCCRCIRVIPTLESPAFLFDRRHEDLPRTDAARQTRRRTERADKR